MVKFTIGLMSGKTVKFTPDEYDMAKKGFNNFNRSDKQEYELYSYLTKISCFFAKDDHGDDVLCVTSAVETIRQCKSIAEQLGKPAPKQTYFEWLKSLDIEALTKELTDMCIQCIEATTGYKYTDEDRKVVYEQNLATMKKVMKGE